MSAEYHSKSFPVFFLNYLFPTGICQNNKYLAGNISSKKTNKCVSMYQRGDRETTLQSKKKSKNELIIGK